MKYILGIDIGTSNTKAIGYTVAGEVITHANVSYNFSSEIEGYHELDPEELFKAVIEVISTAAQSTKNASLEGICFSAAMHGLIAVDASGNPLTKMITWADLRSNAYALELKRSPAGQKIYERTGTPIHPMSPLCKLMWLKKEKADIFNKAHKFISIKEYVFFQLFGDFFIDYSIASATGLFDIYDLKWNEEALKTAGITPDRLSKPVDTSSIYRGFAAKYQNRLGIDRQTPFIMGASDGCLAHLGSNALRPMEVSLTIGTSGAVRIMVDKPFADPRQRIFNYLLTENTYIAGGPLNNGGNTIHWFATNFLEKNTDDEVDYDWFVDEALDTEPGADGLIFLPYIYGERAPVWDADARGVFFGISGAHTRNDFMRAVMEGVSMALFGILETLEELLGNVNNIYASGGFIRSKKWVQLVADVLGRKVQVSQSADASAAGAAIIGMKAVGLIRELGEAASFFSAKESFEPNAANHQVHLRNYAVYSKLYDKLKDLKNTKYADSHNRLG